MSSKLLLSSAVVKRTLARIAHEIAERNEHDRDLVLVGIQRGGIHLAARLAQALSEIWSQPIPTGVVDVSMHRDDLHQQPAREMHATNIPGDITGKTVVLVDDVIYSGRTTRAALDALSDIGRPDRVQLAVLIDRGNRQLPIKPDFIGKTVPTSPDEHITVKLSEDNGDDTVTIDRL